MKTNHTSFLPMSSEDLPQQRVNEVVGLPSRPDGLDISVELINSLGKQYPKGSPRKLGVITVPLFERFEGFSLARVTIATTFSLCGRRYDGAHKKATCDQALKLSSNYDVRGGLSSCVVQGAPGKRRTIKIIRQSSNTRREQPYHR